MKREHLIIGTLALGSYFVSNTPVCFTQESQPSSIECINYNYDYYDNLHVGQMMSGSISLSGSINQ